MENIMANQFKTELAIMAGRAYQDTRNEINFFPILKGVKPRQPDVMTQQ
jgi:hypothetical protein